jgi:hypothetical protein
MAKKDPRKKISEKADWSDKPFPVARPGRGSDQFMVRLPDGMRDTIAKMAERNGRSMNAEIVSALAGHIAHDGEPLKEDEIRVHLLELAVLRAVLEEVRTDVKSLRVSDEAKEILNKMVENERLKRMEESERLNKMQKDPPA